MAATQIGCASDGNVHVKGNLKNVTDTLLALTRETMANPQTVIVKDGAFEFDFPTDKVTSMYLLSPGVLRQQREANPVQLQLLIVP